MWAVRTNQFNFSLRWVINLEDKGETVDVMYLGFYASQMTNFSDIFLSKLKEHSLNE